MKFSKKELKNKASQLADRYSYPDDEDLARPKQIVTDKFYKALLHIIPNVKENHLSIYKTNPDFSTVIKQLEQLGYFFPTQLQLTITKNNKTEYQIKKQAITVKAQDTDYFMDYEADFSEEDYESDDNESLVMEDFLENEEPSQESLLPFKLAFPPKKIYADESALIQERILFSDEVNNFTPSDTPDNSDSETDYPEHYVFTSDLLELCKEDQLLFKELSRSGTPFLCGGAVIDVITGEKKARDRDFVLLVEDIEQLQLPPSFIKDTRKKKHHCYYKTGPSPVDIRVLEVADLNDTRWMHKDVANRDFTICKLYVDKEGYLYDPTNKGKADLTACALSMDGNEPYKLSKSPARIIRAIKYMMREYSNLHFKPDNALVNALQTFTWLNPLKKEHLYTTTRHLLANSDLHKKEMLLSYLNKYFLTYPLFNLDNNCTVEMLTEKVSVKISPFSFHAKKKQTEEPRLHQEETLFSTLNLPTQ